MTVVNFHNKTATLIERRYRGKMYVGNSQGATAGRADWKMRDSAHTKGRPGGLTLKHAAAEKFAM